MIETLLGHTPNYFIIACRIVTILTDIAFVSGSENALAPL